MIKADKWIRRMAQSTGMIEPFEPGQVREVDGKRIVSYGTSSYGYDIRCSREFKIFTNINSTIVDPKAFDEGSFVDFTGDVCIIPPNSFALARTVEYFRIPRNVLTICLGKSTYARCFSGDTRVALVDGTSPTLEEMAQRGEAGELFWGYSVGEHGRVIVTSARYSALRRSRLAHRDHARQRRAHPGDARPRLHVAGRPHAERGVASTRTFPDAAVSRPVPRLRDGVSADQRALACLRIGSRTNGICVEVFMPTFPARTAITSTSIGGTTSPATSSGCERTSTFACTTT